MAKKEFLRTWVSISRSAAKKNYEFFRKLAGPKTKLWSVVKSNAYGHGLFAFSKLLNEFGVDGFCVDSITEGLALRREGILRPILILGPTLATQLPAAEKAKIIVSASCMEDLRALGLLKEPPEFHIKIDTGMRRRGFYPEDVAKIVGFLKSKKSLKNKFTGVFTHFASAKDINYPTYTDIQLTRLKKVSKTLRAEGFEFMEHASATGGALINKKYHLDAVRVGIGLYGLWPSRELEVQLGQLGKTKLYPVLSWQGIVTEIKKSKRGDFVGYDLTERLLRDTKIAILPVGYWHGFPRALSSVGSVLISGKRAKVLGRVSMDLIALDATGINCKAGDIATLIGKNHGEMLSASYLAELSGTTHYEYVTRLNPLMERRIVT
ncbi:MAG: alanine racemase [Candidatus Liptonbacteria bacterium]|nr:alanine racemase [Candidatus Liptonbacteria bacterium]